MARPTTGTVQWSGSRWRARITLADGSRPWVDLPESIGERDIERARAKARELAAYARAHDLRRPPKGPLVGDRETVREYAERWASDREGRGFRSVKDDRQRLETHAFELVGDRPVREVSAKELRAVVASLDAKVREGKLAATTARKAWGVLAKLFFDAQSSKVEALRVRDDNPALAVAPPDGGHAKARAFLYPSELLSLLSCERVALRWRRLYAVAVYSYARAGELEALQVEDVDLARGVLSIHRAVSHTGEVRETKTGDPRRVPIEPALRPLLDVLVRGRPGAERVLSMPPREDGASNLRRHLKLAGVDRAELYADDATRTPLVFHDLRATGITWRAIRGDEPLKIQRSAGHTTLNTTQGYIRTAQAFADGFGEVFPELPRSLLSSDAGDAGDGSTGEGGEGESSNNSSGAANPPAKAHAKPTSHLAVGLSPTLSGLDSGVTGVSSAIVTAASQFRFALVLVLGGLVAGCANHGEQLARAEAHFQQNRYRTALSNLEDLELHRATLSASERVRYDIARGMAHLRLDQPLHARYWLALAREEASNEPTALTRAMRDEIERVIVLTDHLAQLYPTSDAGAAATDASR